MQKRFATIFLATALIAVMAIGMQIESADAKKAQGTYNQKYGKANAGIVCGDRLCSEVGQDENPNISTTGKHMKKSTQDDSVIDHKNKKHGDSTDSITGAILKSNNFDRTSGIITVVIDAFDDGSIKIDIPQINTVDMIIVDGEEWDDAYVDGNTVKVYFLAGTEKIEIVGN
ncbi:MAG: hypothetical protein ACE5RB_03675 [Nitrosopumilus sp.]